MAEPNRTLVSFENGLDEFTEASRLPEGFASALRDWQPENDGSLRVRIGYKRQANGGQPATRKVRGIGFNPKHKHMITDPDFSPAYALFNAETVGGNPGYQLRHISKADLDDAMMNLMTGPSYGAVGLNNEKYLPSVMAGGRLVYATDDFDLLQAWKGDDNTVAAITDSRVGRTLTYFRNRIFTAGGKETTDPAPPDTAQTVNTFSTQPWRLWWSGLGDINAWDTTSLTNPAGYVDVSKDDGQPIECIKPFDQGILIGKSESCFYLAGQGPSSFQLLPLDAGECAPGDSIVVTPYGAVIVGRTDIYLYNGNFPVPIDRPVSLSWDASAAPFVSAAYMDGKVFILHPGDEALVYDFVTQAWHKEAWHVAAANQVSVVHGHDDYLAVGTYDSATEPSLRYRRIPVGDRTVDEGSIGGFLVRTPELWLGGAEGPATLRHVYMRYRQRGLGGPGFEVRVIRNGALFGSIKTVAPEAAEGTHRVRLDTGPTAYSLQFEISAIPAAGEASFDIEEIEIDWLRERAR